jgi:O-antigen/teichoic acid export membrane protein
VIWKLNKYQSTIRHWLLEQLNSGHERSVKARKNIIASFLIRGMSILVGFLLVPVTLNYLDQVRYGIWITLSSILSWFVFFELGLGNGLRNKLAVALAKKDYDLGRIYVSTTYAILTIVIFIVSSLFFIANRFIDWTIIFNTNGLYGEELTTLTYAVFGFFFFRFVFQLIGYVVLADQRPALENLFNPLGSLLSLIIIFILTKTTSSSLLYIGITLSVCPLLILIIASLYLFKNNYSKISPSLRYVDFSYGRDLLGLGIKFFLIQLAGLILYSSSNFIITQFFGPSMVTPYHIAYRLFSVISMLFVIVMVPYWSAFTEAWETGDILWIKTSVGKLIQVWVLLSFGGLILLLISPYIFRIWVGEEIHVPFSLSFLLYFYFVTYTFGGIFTMFINGVGKIKLQLILSLFLAIAFIPICYLLIRKVSLGVEALVIATIICNVSGFVITPIQYYKIINKKAVGIWNK